MKDQHLDWFEKLYSENFEEIQAEDPEFQEYLHLLKEIRWAFDRDPPLSEEVHRRILRVGREQAKRNQRPASHFFSSPWMLALGSAFALFLIISIYLWNVQKTTLKDPSPSIGTKISPPSKPMAKVKRVAQPSFQPKVSLGTFATPPKVPLTINGALELYFHGELKRAVELLSDLSRSENPQTRREAQFYLAKIWFHHKKPEKAILILQNLFREPELSLTLKRQTLLLLAQCLIQVNRQSEALIYLDQLVQLGGDESAVAQNMLKEFSKPSSKP